MKARYVRQFLLQFGEIKQDDGAGLEDGYKRIWCDVALTRFLWFERVGSDQARSLQMIGLPAAEGQPWPKDTKAVPMGYVTNLTGEVRRAFWRRTCRLEYSDSELPWDSTIYMSLMFHIELWNSRVWFDVSFFRGTNRQHAYYGSDDGRLHVGRMLDDVEAIGMGCRLAAGLMAELPVLFDWLDDNKPEFRDALAMLRAVPYQVAFIHKGTT